MDENQKRFNWFVFFSTFARNLIEVFIGTILYKAGFRVQEVVLFHLLMHVFGLILAYPCVAFAKRFSNRVLAFIGILAFVILQLMLNTIVQSTTYLVITGFLYAMYRTCYWIARRYYNFKVIKKQNIASSYSIVSIINQVSIVVASYVGSLLLDFVSIKVLTAISIIIFLISVLSLYGMRFDHEKNDEKLNPIATLKKIPKGTIYLFGSYELLTCVKFFIPLYIFININNSYQTIGIFNLISNVATVIVTYLYGKKINSDKNYYRGCIILVVLIFIMKVNVSAKLLFLVSFLDGIFTKMLELSINKEVFVLSKKFEYYNYNLAYEIIHSVARVIVVTLIYFFVFDLKNMVYVTLLFMVIGVFFKFKDIDDDYYRPKDDKTS